MRHPSQLERCVRLSRGARTDPHVGPPRAISKGRLNCYRLLFRSVRSHLSGDRTDRKRNATERVMRTMIVMSRYEHEPSDRGIPMTTIVRLVRSIFISTADFRASKIAEFLVNSRIARASNSAPAP